MPSPELLGFVSTTRDWVIILMGLAVFLFFTVGLVLLVVLGLLSRALLKKSINVMDDNLKPLLGSAKESVDNVKGTTRFVGNAVVTPIVKTYGVVAGVRRAASMMASLNSAKSDGRPSDDT